MSPPSLGVQSEADVDQFIGRVIERAGGTAGRLVQSPAGQALGALLKGAAKLALQGDPYAVPPVICYRDRGVGAAIRRARTRLPGGGANPVAIIRVPRERLIGSAIASSLFHEVGHQAAALLELVESLRPVVKDLQLGRARDARVWQYFEHCLSEIVADFFSIARVGVTSTVGLMGVVSLPRAFAGTPARRTRRHAASVPPTAGRAPAARRSGLGHSP